jgi:hypothetical protein
MLIVMCGYRILSQCDSRMEFGSAAPLVRRAAPRRAAPRRSHK